MASRRRGTRLVLALAALLGLSGTVSAAPAPAPAPLPILDGLHMFGPSDGWAIPTLGGEPMLVTRDGGALWAPAGPSGSNVTAMPNRQGTNPDPSTISQGAPGATLAVHACAGLACRLLWTEAWTRVSGPWPSLDLFQSANGARSWVNLHQRGLPAPPETVSMQQLWESNPFLSFPTPMDGWALWYAGTPDVEDLIFHSASGGRQWAKVGLLTMTRGLEGSPPPAGVPARLFFATPTNGWFVGTSYGFAWLYATSDGGHTWSNVRLPIPASYAGYLVTTDVPRFSSPADGVLPVTFTEQVLDPSAPGGQRTLAAVLLYVTRDGGRTWTPTKPVQASATSGAPLWAAIGTGQAWVISGSQVIQETVNGGRSWQAVPADTSLARAALLNVVPPDLGWVAEYRQNATVLLHTADSGRHWTTLPAKVG